MGGLAMASSSSLPSRAVAQWAGPSVWNGTILVGTHHKSGTVLFAQVFREAARLEGVPRYKSHLQSDPRGPCAPLAADPHGVGVCIEQHVSMARLRSFSRPGVRFVHVVRDPLEMCVSSYQYNLHSTEVRTG